MKKTAFAAFAAAAVLALAVPAAAETFTASNGILSIDLPDDSWKEMTDPARWIVLSDGANMITIDHLANGEELPVMSVADDHYVNVYQAVYSTQNEVFIITGSVVDAAKIPEIANAIISTKVLVFDTKTKVRKDAAQPRVEDFSMTPLNKTMYVISDGLNVRRGCSTTEMIVGSLVYGQSVQVTGSVLQNGAEIGWYQVSFGGGTGYVSSAYLSDSAPAAKEEKKTVQGLSFTGTATTVYAMSGTAVTIYKATDGNWYDGNGTKFTWLSQTQLTNEGGDSFATYNPAGSGSDSVVPTGGAFMVYWTNGNGEYLTPYSDGSYYSSSGVKYWATGGGAYAGDDGTTLYDSMPNLGGTGENESHGLVSQGSGRPVQVFAGGGAFYDESGTEYHRLDDGTFVDSNGDYFNMEW
ncbi:MAG: SH3 domain-containing protein [Lachnospiraceae bacterium]|nr:SH3 domain-containing protein [Lachnospiraceae bacterium]